MAEYFRARRIFDGHQWQDGKLLCVEDGRVKGVVADNDDTDGVIDIDARFIAPGFVDLQVNGGGGVLLNNDTSVDGITKICAAHLSLGTTALFPTLITDTPEVTQRALEAAIAAAKENVAGFAGLHLEGPHLSIARKGAHDPALIRPMTDEDIDRMIKARPQLPALLTTVAAENVTPDQVKKLVDAGIIVSIGHTDTTYESATALAQAGATLVTHLFNAQSQLTNREPGVVGAALDIGSLNASLIADGVHVHPATMANALRAKNGPGRIFLVSDAMSPVGTDTEQFELNGRTIYRSGGILKLADGTLAGADITMAQSVKVLCEKVGVELDEALRMSSTYPADVADLKHLGTLNSGAAADFVVMDESLAVTDVYYRGSRIG